MRYVNVRLVKIVSLAALISMLIACGASTPSQDLSAGEDVYSLKLTEAYLPVDQFDKAGFKLPYESTPNPYDLQNSRIKKSSITRYIAARRAFKSENYDVATEELTALTTEDTSLSGPWVMLGDISMLADDSETAEQRYRKAIAINDQNVNAYLRLARVMRIKGRYLEAQNLYADTLALWPDFPEAHLNIAILYDVYMNKSLLAQQHMEAYQFLTNNKDEQVASWLSEIQSRTGVTNSIKAGKHYTQAALSVAGGAQ